MCTCVLVGTCLPVRVCVDPEYGQIPPSSPPIRGTGQNSRGVSSRIQMISPLMASPTSCLLRGATNHRASAVIYGMRPWNVVKGLRYSYTPRQTPQRTAARFDGQPTATGEQLLQPFKQTSKAIQQRVGRVELIFGPMFAGKCLPCMPAIRFPCKQASEACSQRPKCSMPNALCRQANRQH